MPHHTLGMVQCVWPLPEARLRVCVTGSGGVRVRSLLFYYIRTRALLVKPQHVHYNTQIIFLVKCKIHEESIKRK